MRTKDAFWLIIDLEKVENGPFWNSNAWKVKNTLCIDTISAMQGNLENVGATHLLNASKLNTNITIDLKINNGCLDNSVWQF